MEVSWGGKGRGGRGWRKEGGGVEKRGRLEKVGSCMEKRRGGSGESWYRVWRKEEGGVGESL